MVKVRPVIVVSPKSRNAETCVVVPLSTVPPEPIQSVHHLLDPLSLPESLRGIPTWVKGDMVCSVALHRLDRVRNGRVPGGTGRVYVAQQIGVADWIQVRRCVLFGLGMDSLAATLTGGQVGPNNGDVPG
jgi:mRNA interferase MazF